MRRPSKQKRLLPGHTFLKGEICSGKGVGAAWAARGRRTSYRRLLFLYADISAPKVDIWAPKVAAYFRVLRENPRIPTTNRACLHQLRPLHPTNQLQI